MKTDMTLFEEFQIRRVYDEDKETWWFSVVDIVRVLTQKDDYQAARKYWNKLKQRLAQEGNQSVTNCHRLKLHAADGKKYLTEFRVSRLALTNRLIENHFCSFGRPLTA
ncbi:MAG: hypothetical protein IBX47_11390 [Desulfuromonadales bacterium]|nr:hypothetical protein [Desulfuromonadales bacterium]